MVPGHEYGGTNITKGCSIEVQPPGLFHSPGLLGSHTDPAFYFHRFFIFFKGSRYADQYREDSPVAGPLVVGVLAGFVSGLLGVGGIISPLMVVQGFNPKKVAMVTAFSVPFSSFSAFITYAAMGSVSVKILGFAGLAAWAGGYLGTRVMQKKMTPQSVKRLLGGVLILIGIKFLWSMV